MHSEKQILIINYIDYFLSSVASVSDIAPCDKMEKNTSGLQI